MIHNGCCRESVNEVGDSVVGDTGDRIRVVCVFFMTTWSIFHHPASHVMENLILPPFDFSPSLSQVMTDYSLQRDVSWGLEGRDVWGIRDDAKQGVRTCNNGKWCRSNDFQGVDTISSPTVDSELFLSTLSATEGPNFVSVNSYCVDCVQFISLVTYNLVTCTSINILLAYINLYFNVFRIREHVLHNIITVYSWIYCSCLSCISLLKSLYIYYRYCPRILSD